MLSKTHTFLILRINEFKKLRMHKIKKRWKLRKSRVLKLQKFMHSILSIGVLLMLLFRATTSYYIINNFSFNQDNFIIFLVIEIHTEIKFSLENK